MRKILEILGTVVSIFVAAYGCVLMVMGLEIIVRPPEPALPGWQVYYLDFKDSGIFQMGCVAISLGLTFLLFQARRSALGHAETQHNERARGATP